jgi:hypothetical protein
MLHVPCAVDSRNGVAFLASVHEKSQEVITGNNTGRDKVNKRGHGGRKYESVPRRMGEQEDESD